MTDKEKQQRELVVAEARSWLRTPYAHMQRVKGHGADCAMFPLGVYSALDLIVAPEIEYYPLDWHLHRDAERYLDVVTTLAVEVDGLEERKPLPGDFCVVKFGRCYSHGLIVLEWPLCIHSHLAHGVQLVDAELDPQLSARPTKVFVLNAWAPKAEHV